jgi:hypothetical protein
MSDEPSGVDTFPHGTLPVGTMRSVIHIEGVNRL